MCFGHPCPSDRDQRKAALFACQAVFRYNSANGQAELTGRAFVAEGVAARDR
jgi:hypothetical protein